LQKLKQIGLDVSTGFIIQNYNPKSKLLFTRYSVGTLMFFIILFLVVTVAAEITCV